MKQNALIIGAAGFVGGYLARELLSNGFHVSLTKLPFENINIENTDVFNCDVTSYNSVYETVTAVQPDVIYHLAAQSSVKVSWEKPSLTLDINVNGTLNLLEVCRTLPSENRPRILLIGSAEEYGKVTPDMCPINEECSCNPANIYALSKLTQNHLGRLYASAYGLDIINVRAFNHTGPGQSPSFVLSDFCRQVAEIERGRKTPIIRVGNLDAKRDFTDVRDIVKAYILLSEKGKSGETYNVGSGKAISISELLSEVLSTSDTEIKIETDPEKLRPSDVPLHVADISKIREETGWTPTIPLSKTIKDTLEAHRDNI